jgi:DNA-binding MarR family transcriptional regulator
MIQKKPSRAELTPAGRLDEAGLHQVLGYQLAQASIVTDALYVTHIGSVFGLKPVEYTVLKLIHENPGGSLVQLARALAVTAPHITMMVERLESRGWIARSQSPDDRRSQVLRTTVKGARLVRDATSRIIEAEGQAVPLTPAERAMLVELLHKVACARAVGKQAAAKAA